MSFQSAITLAITLASEIRATVRVVIGARTYKVTRHGVIRCLGGVA